MTPTETNNLRHMEGMPVKIKWRRPEDDWPYFRLLEVNTKGATVKLRGMDFPDGSAKHVGNEFWSDLAEIVRIEPVIVRG